MRANCFACHVQGDVVSLYMACKAVCPQTAPPKSPEKKDTSNMKTVIVKPWLGMWTAFVAV